MEQQASDDTRSLAHVPQMAVDLEPTTVLEQSTAPDGMTKTNREVGPQTDGPAKINPGLGRGL